MIPRRSVRLQALHISNSSNDYCINTDVHVAPSEECGKDKRAISKKTRSEITATKRMLSAKTSKGAVTKKFKSSKRSVMVSKSSNATFSTDSKFEAVDQDQAFTSLPTCLPRSRENELKFQNVKISHIMGIDEAGRGPLAGPVVVAAAIVTTNIPGIVDSKKVTRETDREALYHKIITSPGVRWAVAVIDAARIDEVNILQATLQGMRMAAETLLAGSSKTHKYPCIDQTGCYVYCNGTDNSGDCNVNCLNPLPTPSVYALIDGNRVPDEMPCEAEALIKGDSKEFSIAAASILAKVTRDRLMAEYSVLYPNYDLKQNKGYPTPAHMAAVREFGASPIHRRTFAPLKHMNLDEKGRVLSDDSKQ